MASAFDTTYKIYYGSQEIPKINLKDKYWWDKFNFDIQKFEIVEEEE